MISERQFGEMFKGSYEEKMCIINEGLSGEKLLATSSEFCFVESEGRLERWSYSISEGKVSFGEKLYIDRAYSDVEADAILSSALYNIVDEILEGKELDMQLISQIAKTANPNGVYSKATAYELLSEANDVERLYLENESQIRSALRGKLGKIEDSFRVIKVGRFEESSLVAYRDNLYKDLDKTCSFLESLKSRDWKDLDESVAVFVDNAKRALAFAREMGNLKEMANCLSRIESKTHQHLLVFEYLINEME